MLLGALFIIFSGCDKSNSASVDNQYSANVQSTAATLTNTNSNVGADVNQANDSKDDSDECVRAVPEAIIEKSVFPKTNFTLEKNKEFPFNPVRFETVEFENGDKLTIENYGCENYTLTFRFQTSRFFRKPDDVEFWYKTDVQLMEQTMKGIR